MIKHSDFQNVAELHTLTSTFTGHVGIGFRVPALEGAYLTNPRRFCATSSPIWNFSWGTGRSLNHANFHIISCQAGVLGQPPPQAVREPAF